MSVCLHVPRVAADRVGSRSFGVSAMAVTDDPPDKWQIRRILICALFGPIALLWAGTTVLPLITFGEAQTAVGVVSDRRMIGPSHRHGCQLYIERGKTELVRTLDVAAYCGADFTPGATVTFVYERNLFGKMVLDDAWAVRPVRTQPASSPPDAGGR